MKTEYVHVCVTGSPCCTVEKKCIGDILFPIVVVLMLFKFLVTSYWLPTKDFSKRRCLETHKVYYHCIFSFGFLFITLVNTLPCSNFSYLVFYVSISVFSYSL